MDADSLLRQKAKQKSFREGYEGALQPSVALDS